MDVPRSLGSGLGVAPPRRVPPPSRDQEQGWGPSELEVHHGHPIKRHPRGSRPRKPGTSPLPALPPRGTMPVAGSIRNTRAFPSTVSRTGNLL